MNQWMRYVVDGGPISASRNRIIEIIIMIRLTSMGACLIRINRQLILTEKYTRSVNRCHCCCWWCVCVKRRQRMNETEKFGCAHHCMTSKWICQSSDVFDIHSICNQRIRLHIAAGALVNTSAKSTLISRQFNLTICTRNELLRTHIRRQSNSVFDIIYRTPNLPTIVDTISPEPSTETRATHWNVN